MASDPSLVRLAAQMMGPIDPVVAASNRGSQGERPEAMNGI
jgi:hypothetical protein